MRTKFVDKHAMVVIKIIGISAQVAALLDDQTSLSLLRDYALRNSQAGKTSANNQHIKIPRHYFSILFLAQTSIVCPTGFGSTHWNIGRRHACSACVK